MGKTPAHRSFTVTCEGLSSVLPCPVGVARGSGTDIPADKVPWVTFDAIWDTGATHTAITRKVVEQCRLPESVQVVEVSTSAGVDLQPAHMVNLLLPSGLAFPNVRVTECRCTADVLVGMDIINKGDLAITNKDGVTKFSFRTPSVEHIEFEKVGTIHRAVSFKKKKRRRRGR